MIASRLNRDIRVRSDNSKLVTLFIFDSIASKMNFKCFSFQQTINLAIIVKDILPLNRPTSM